MSSKIKSKKRKIPANAKIRSRGKKPNSRQKKSHVDRQKKAAFSFMELVERLVEAVPSAEHILRKLTTSSFPLINPFDLKAYKSNVYAWVPGKGSTAGIPVDAFSFADVSEEQRSAATMSSWDATKRLLMANGQVRGKKFVFYYGYLIIFDENFAIPVPHCWVSVEDHYNPKKIKRCLLDPSLATNLAPLLLNLLFVNFLDVPNFEKESKQFSLLNRGYVAGEVPDGLLYVGAPADAESAEATIRWWTQAVVSDQKEKGISLEAPESCTLASILQFIRTLTDHAHSEAVDGKESKAVSEESGDQVSSRSDDDDGGRDIPVEAEEAGSDDEGDNL